MGNGFGSLYIGASGLQNAQYALNNGKQPCKCEYNRICPSAGSFCR